MIITIREFERDGEGGLIVANFKVLTRYALEVTSKNQECNQNDRCPVRNLNTTPLEYD
jgi:hypothetical protein